MFVHLHSHSYYSFLQATASPKAMVGAAKAAGFEALALTDSANTCGVVEAFEAAEKEKCKLVVGVEIWTIDGESADGPAPGVQLVLLVRDHGGWKNLCRLLTTAHRQRNYTPRIRLDQLKEHREGLHVLTGSRFGLFREDERAKERLLTLVEAVGKDSLDVEVCDLGFDEDGPRNDLAISLAKELSLPVLATNDVRYLRAEDCGLLEAMGVIATADLALSRLASATDQATLKTEAGMAELFPRPFLDRTAEVAALCSFVLPRGKPMLPRVSEDETIADIMARFPAPKGFPTPPKRLPGKGKPVDRWFRWLTREGLKIRLREEPHALNFWTEEEYFRQLEFECGVIEEMDYVVYHLIVSEFTNWAKDNDVAVGPGRGSAAGSVAVWALRITDVNPRQFGLFFERFLNPERRGLPDIDMDFEQEGRERVVAHVREKYGEACVGQILTIGKMKAKAALKDAARVCDVHFEESNRWSRLVPEGPKVKLKDSLDFGYLGAMRIGSPLFRRVSDLALLLEGKPRQQGVHAAGVIIASDPLTDFCPMHYVPEDALTCTGVDMEASEKIGLVKFDFLGLKTLDVIKRAVASVVARTGSVPATVDPLFDDPAVFEMLRKADTEGIFQLDTPGMTRLIKRLQPTSFEDVICMLALYRPGPLKSGMVDSWVERRHGREKIESIHPLLDALLAPTYGLMVYQEQAISTARILAGFSLGNADLLRRAIGKKKADEMAAQRSAFVQGCRETNGIDEKEATRIFNLIDYFSGYSFNKCVDIATPVVTGRGVIRADEVVAGDSILEVCNGRFRPGSVRRVWPIERKERLRIVFDDGSEVVCTAEHRFIDFDSSEEVRADRAASEGRRLAFLVRKDDEDQEGKNGAHEEMRWMPADPAIHQDQERPGGMEEGQGRDHHEDEGELASYWSPTEARGAHDEVRAHPPDPGREEGTSSDLPGMHREEEADPLGDHVEELEGPRNLHAGSCFVDCEEDFGTSGRAAGKGRSTPCMEEEGARAVPEGMYGANARLERCGPEPLHDLVPGGHDFRAPSDVPQERAGEDLVDRPAGGLRRDVHGGGGRSTPLRASVWGSEVRGHEVPGQDPHAVGHGVRQDPGPHLHRLLHQLGIPPSPVEGDRGVDLEGPTGWRLVGRRPVRVDRLAVGPVVDLEVGGDHLFVLGNGLISHNSHSASYAIISYMTAKLKAYHRADLVAAAMTFELGSQNYQAHVRRYVSVLRRSKIQILRPDVNHSGAAFTEEDGAVRFGLRAVKGLGHAQLPQLLANRPYTDVVDLVERGQVHRSVAETLIWSGALDSVEPDRFEAWWKLHRPKPKALPKKVAAEQILLFGGGKTVGDVKAEQDEAEATAQKPARPTSMEISDRETLALGVTLGEHPLRTFEDVAVRVRTHSIDDLYRIGAEKSPFVLVVRVEAVDLDEDRRGDPVAFVTFEDGGSSLEVVLRSQVLSSIDRDATLFVGACVAAHGVADAFDPENPRVVVERLEPMPDFRWRVGRVVEIEVRPSDREILPAIRKLLDDRTTDGTHDVQLSVRADGDETRLLLDRKISPSDELVASLERLCGRPNVMRLPRVGNGRKDDAPDEVEVPDHLQEDESENEE